MARHGFLHGKQFEFVGRQIRAHQLSLHNTGRRTFYELKMITVSRKTQFADFSSSSMLYSKCKRQHKQCCYVVIGSDTTAQLQKTVRLSTQRSSMNNARSQPSALQPTGPLAGTLAAPPRGGESRLASQHAVAQNSPTSDHLTQSMAQSEAQSASDAPDRDVLSEAEFDVYVGGDSRPSSEPTSEPVCDRSQKPPVASPQQHNAWSVAHNTDALTSFRQTDAMATAEIQALADSACHSTSVQCSMEIPASMDDAVMMWMYDDCCPSSKSVDVTRLPNEVTFILTFIDPDDSSFFWAAFLHRDLVCCEPDERFCVLWCQLISCIDCMHTHTHANTCACVCATIVSVTNIA